MPILKPPKLDLEELSQIQLRIARRVVEEDRWRRLERVAGCDLSFARGDQAVAACVVLDRSSLEVLEERVAKVKLRFPYIPTFLAFRELEGMLRVARGVRADVFMVGAQGKAHPRRAGLACHLGVVLNKPALGVAKSRLCGEAEEPPRRRGAYTLLKEGEEVLGVVLRTKPGSKPVYVSVGHKLSLETAIQITLDTSRAHRLPEPLRLAHKIATERISRL